MSGWTNCSLRSCWAHDELDGRPAYGLVAGQVEIRVTEGEKVATQGCTRGCAHGCADFRSECRRAAGAGHDVTCPDGDEHAVRTCSAQRRSSVWLRPDVDVDRQQQLVHERAGHGE